MSSRINGLKLRRTFGPKWWHAPVPFGDDGFFMQAKDITASVIVNAFDWADGPWLTAGPWVHASIARNDRMPDYDDLCLLHKAVWPEDGWSYQMFVPAARRGNIHNFALHLWGRLDGKPVLPDFVGTKGTI